MIAKNEMIDPELDDGKLFKDVPGMFTAVAIKENKNYDSKHHPKYLIGNSQVYFDKIFSMLKTTESNQVENVWALINKLPMNIELK
jgi:hypothetical protein